MTPILKGDVARTPSGGIKVVPQEAEIRKAIRIEAERISIHLDRRRPLKRAVLEELSRSALERIGLDRCYLGFAMVAVSNEFWRDQFASIPSSRRLLLLPHCLRSPTACRGTYSSLGLTCRRCGACVLFGMQEEAESLGYRVLIAEGTPAVVQIVLGGHADAILGVACLDSLEKAFRPVLELGIPHAAVPLLRDGCTDTVVEEDVVRKWMRLSSGPAGVRTRTYVPLLRAAEDLFEKAQLGALLPEGLSVGRACPGSADMEPMTGTENMAFDWLLRGGKRFRPFITLASYAALTCGRQVLDPGADLHDTFPTVVKRVAVAIEALHKASLVHDDIEDDDCYRYGGETLHRRYGLAPAVNVGDYLIGLGYHLVSSGKDDLGADCTAAILAHICEAHLDLCRGQGAELLWRERDPQLIRPHDAQAVYALKTAPAFEAAVYAGIEMARSVVPKHDTLDANVERSNGREGARKSQMGNPHLVRPFCRYVGTAYQVLNDLKDWSNDTQGKVVAGRDCLSARPTILRAFAYEAGDDADNRELLDIAVADMPEEAKLSQLRRIYEARGVFDKADRLVQKYRERARLEADRVAPAELRELMHFIVETVL